MDTLIENGDFALAENGVPIQISGIQKIAQSAMIKLCVKKGSFIYDKDLGSDLLSIDFENIDESIIFSMVSEALSDLKDVYIKSIEKVLDKENEHLYIKVFLKIQGQDIDISIKNNGGV